jgi:hypothetical protein
MRGANGIALALPEYICGASPKCAHGAAGAVRPGDRRAAVAGLGRAGRPPRAEVPSHARVEILVTEEEHARLRQLAQENRSTLAGIVREAVNEYVSEWLERRDRVPPKA